MASQQVGCIVVSDSINAQAFIDMFKDTKVKAESPCVDDKGQKYIPLVKKD
jgi:hypothetical protein